MAKINTHHLNYEQEPENVVEIQMSHHRVISRIQHSKANPALYVQVTNFLHALVTDWSRIRYDLEHGCDTRIIKPKKPVVKKKNIHPKGRKKIGK